MAEWKNYLNELEVHGTRLQPRTSTEVLGLVQRAAAAGQRVRAVGAGHSSSDVARPASGESFVDIGRLGTVLDWPFYVSRDMSARYVRVGAGASIKRVNDLLDSLPTPKALNNMGNYDAQTIAGAFSTGTHGSGLNHPPLCDRVAAIELVTDERHPLTGERVQRLLRLEPKTQAISDKARFDRERGGFVDPTLRSMELEQDDQVFNAALVALGCFGIIVAVTLEVRDRFWLEETETVHEWNASTSVQELALSAPEFLQLTLEPHRMPVDADPLSGKVAYLRTTRSVAATGPEPGPTRHSFWEDLARDLAVAFSTGALENIGLKHPTKALKSLLRAFRYRAKHSGFRSVSYRVLINSLAPEVDATSIDVWVPLEHASAAIQRVVELAALNETLDGQWSPSEWFHTSPIGVRTIARSRALLAPSWDGPKCSIEIPLLYDLSELPNERERHIAYRDAMMKRLEAELTSPSFGGRPHWGQRNWLTASRVRSMYGARWVAWKRCYNRFNAFGTFDNDFTRRMLGTERIHLLAVAHDKSLQNRWQRSANGAWNEEGWGSLAGHELQQISAITNADGRIEVFALGGDGIAYHRWQRNAGGAWNEAGWETLGGRHLRQVLAASNQDGRIELFALGGDGCVYHRWQREPNGGWNSEGWGSLAGGSFMQLALGNDRDGRIELFALGGDGCVYHRWQREPNGGWNDENWGSLGGSRLRQLAVTNNLDGRLELFAVGGDGVVYNRWQREPNGGWNDENWGNLGGGEFRQLVAASNEDGRVELFALDGQGTLHSRWQRAANGRWNDGGWGSLGGTDIKQVAVVPNADGRLEVFAVGGDGIVYNRWQTTRNGGWNESGWSSLGGNVVAVVGLCVESD